MSVQDNQTTTRPLYAIAREIMRDWKSPNYAAIPYLKAMQSVTSLDDAYGADDGLTIVLYFLSNANTWKGETARRVKHELKAMCNEHTRRKRY